MFNPLPPLTNPRQLVIEDPTTGTIRFTRTGVERFRDRFAKIGIDIRNLRTKEDFLAAHTACFNSEISLAAILMDNPVLDEIMAEIPAWQDGRGRR